MPSTVCPLPYGAGLHRITPREAEPYVHCQTTYSTANRKAGKSREPWQGFTFSRVFRGKRIEIEVKNPKGLQHGVKSLLVDGKKVDGNLVPVAALKDGLKVVAVIGE